MKKLSDKKPSDQNDQHIDLVATDGDQTQIAGYDSAELVKAPFKPPEPSKIDSTEATESKNVHLLIGLGVILGIVGLLIMIINLLIGFMIMIAGGVMVMVSVFAPIK
jgi:hypothetical protein